MIMASFKSIFHTAALGGAIGLAFISPGRADGAVKTMPLSSLQKIVAGLGFEDAGDKKTYIEIDNQGKNSIAILFFPTDDDKVLYIYSNLGEISKDKMALLPAERMLEYNDTHPFYFTVSGSDEKKNVYLEARLDASTITPQLLRQRIDGLIASADETTELWSQDGWKASTADTEKSYKVAEAEADSAWEKAPMSIDRALFATERVSAYRAYVTRSNNSFKPGDTIVTYMEPVSYAWVPGDDGTFKLGVSVDIEVRSEAGEVVFSKDKFVTAPLVMHDKNKRLYLDMTLSLPDTFPSGTYAVKYTVHDLYSPKVATSTLPFKIAK